MYRDREVRNPNMRAGMSSEQLWNDHVRWLMTVLIESGVGGHQYGERATRALDRAS